LNPKRAQIRQSKSDQPRELTCRDLYLDLGVAGAGRIVGVRAAAGVGHLIRQIVSPCETQDRRRVIEAMGGDAERMKRFSGGENKRACGGEMWSGDRWEEQEPRSAR
jgi:hypothetical protein